jgi:hypothetical protein
VTHRPQVSPDLLRFWLVPMAVAGVMCVVAGFTPIIDDGYIYLDYVRTLVETGGWGLVPDLFSDTATAPLNVLYLTPFWIATGHSVDMTLALAQFLPTFVLCAFLLRTYRRGPVLPVLLTVIIGFLPPVISSIGLETSWTAAMLAGVWWGITRRGIVSEVRGVEWGVAIGAAVAMMLRPDAAFFMLPLLLALCVRDRRWWRSAATAMALLVAYVLARWVILGSFVPDSVWIKQNQAGTWGHYTFFSGWELFVTSARTSVVVLGIMCAVAIVTIVVAASRCRRVDVLLTHPATYYLGATAIYIVVAGVSRVPPYHWYYVLPSVASVLAVTGILQEGSRRVRRATVVGVVSLLVILLGEWSVQTMRGEPVIGTNWATEAQMYTLATGIRPYVRGQRVQLEGEIGEIAYYCHCRLEEEFSLSTGLRRRVTREIAEGGWGLRWRINYHFREWPQPQPPPRWKLTFVTPRPGEHVVYQQDTTTFQGDTVRYSLIRRGR